MGPTTQALPRLIPTVAGQADLQENTLLHTSAPTRNKGGVGPIDSFWDARMLDEDGLTEGDGQVVERYEGVEIGT